MTQALISTVSDTLTMSSREIADLCEKQHKDVMRDIRNMLEELGETSAQFCADLPDAYGRPQPVFNLPKDLTITLVAGYNVKLRKRIIDRWMELEAQKQSASPANLSRIELLQLAMQAEQERLALVAKVDAMKPDADAFARIAKADGTFCITDAAKALNIQPKRLFDYLKTEAWIYKRPGGKHWLGYQSKVQAGLISHITTTVTLTDGTDRLHERVMVTPKGLARLAKDFPSLPLPVR